MPLLELPVELQREIYGYLICPGFISIRSGTGYVESRPFTRQRSGRIPQWTLTPLVSPHSRMADDGVIEDMCRRLSANWAEYLMEIMEPGSSRFSAYQATHLKQQEYYRTITVIDCNPHGSTARVSQRAVSQHFCTCVFCGSLTRFRLAPNIRSLLDLDLLRVCKDLYTIAKDMIWEENTFHFEKQADFESFLASLQEWQKAKMKKLQVGRGVVLLLGGDKY